MGLVYIKGNITMKNHYKYKMFEYLNCQKTIIAFERQRYTLKRCFKNTIEWKCQMWKYPAKLIQ